MKAISTGEGRQFFPHFFLLPAFLVFFLLCCACFWLLEAAGQEKERGKLSAFDRLAEEATLLNKHGKFDQVIALLEPHKGEKKNDSALFFNELGVAYRHKGNFPAAIQAYESALARDPENPVVMKNLGDALLFNREYDRAVAQYEKAVRSNPRFQQAYSGLGIALYRLQRYPEALDQFEIVLKLDPRDEQAQKFREAIQKKLPARKKSN